MKELKKLTAIFSSYSQVKLAYFFGSRANGNGGPLSDYDFAVYLEEKSCEKMSEIKLALLDSLTHVLGTDHIDLVVLNTTESPELKYNIITQGRLIYERGPFKSIVEPRILNAYFDFRALLLRHNLTNS